MTRSTAAPVSLFAAFEQDSHARASKTAAEVAEATTRYWQVVDRIASGDESGGVSRKDFADILASIGFTLARARDDVATVQRLRQVRADIEAGEVKLRDAQAAANAAEGAWRNAKDALELARIARERTGANASQIGEALSQLRILIRDELRSVEAVLRAAGFVGELLAPPAPTPPKRRWRFRNGSEATMYANAPWPLQDGSEVDMPHDWGGGGAVDTFGRPWSTLIGVVTPDMPPPSQKPVPSLADAKRAANGAGVVDLLPTLDTDVAASPTPESPTPESPATAPTSATAESPSLPTAPTLESAEVSP